MATIGDVLTTPENGWQRIDDTNININYIGSWTFYQNNSFYNGTSHHCKSNDYVLFYFYGSKLRIISEYFNNRDTNNLIIIDDVEYNFNCYSTTKKSKVIAFEKLDLQKGCHTVKIANMNVGKYFLLDCIDIDEDGYMVYCDDNGKLYYDVTPIMTSNNTPTGYEVSESSYFDSVYMGYQAFNGSNIDSYTCYVSAVNDLDPYIQLKFNKKMLINNLLIISRNGYLSNFNNKSFKMRVQGSDDGITFTNINDFTVVFTDINQYKIINIDTSKYNYYRFYTNKCDIGEIRYLLDVDTSFYLIKDNSNNKVYNYDEENNSLIEVTDISILNSDALNNTCIYDLNKVTDLIDLTDENILILTNKNVKLNVEGIKSDKELIISNQNLSTVNADVIHNFILETNKVANGDIKFVISNDNGVTWQTWNGANWTSLTNTCSLKKYSKLSDSEKIQWNKLRDEIWTSGINTDIADVDYNSILTNKTIRFAFVLYRPTYDDNITLKDTKWLYDKVGSWHKLSEDDIDIAINSNMCTVTPKLQNLEHVKVNILL